MCRCSDAATMHSGKIWFTVVCGTCPCRHHVGCCIAISKVDAQPKSKPPILRSQRPTLQTLRKQHLPCRLGAADVCQDRTQQTERLLTDLPMHVFLVTVTVIRGATNIAAATAAGNRAQRRG